MKNAEKLINDVTKKIQSSEYGTVKMKGVSNLSRSDLEDTIMYAQNYIQHDGQSFGNVMSPVGGTEELLKAYGIEVKSYGFF